MAPLYTTPFATYDFPAPETRDIDGVAASLGTLDRDPTSLEGNSLGVLTQGLVTAGAAQSYARDNNNPMAKYQWNGLTGLDASAHRVEMIPTFPAHDDPPVTGNCGLTDGTSLLHDDCTGADVDSIAGEGLTGGGATWAYPITGSTASLQRIDNEFTADPDPGHGGDGSALASGSSIPSEGDYRVRVKGYFAAFQNKDANNTPQSFGAILRAADNNTGDIFKTGGFLVYLRTAPLDGANKYRIGITGTATTEVLVAGTLSLNTEYTVDVTISGRGYICARVYDGGTLKGTNAGIFVITPSRRYEYPYSPGCAIHAEYATVDELESERTAYITDFEVLAIAEEPPISGGVNNEDARNEVAVRVSADGLTGYYLRQYFNHFDVDPALDYELGYRDSGTETVIYRLSDHASALTVAHDTMLPFSLAIDPSNVLHAYDGDAELVAHTLGTDLADDTGDVVPIFDPSGTVPGIGGFDANGFGFTDRPLSVTVYMEGGETPCEGPPENPYPHDPPPGTPEELVRLWARDDVDARWKPVRAPGPGITEPGLFPFDGGRANTIVGLAIQDEGRWWPISDPTVENPPPYEGPDPPPFSDPCDELSPPSDPPDVPLDPLADRVFLCGQMPATRIGIFNCASRAVWSGSPHEAAQAAALGGYLQVAQGGYDKFIVGGAYSQTAYFDWVDSVTTVLATLVGLPNFTGLQFIDDWASSVRWPPSGISVAQMSAQTSYLLSAVPGLKLIARARPRQWPGSPGTAGVDYPTGIWGVMCQYSYWAVHGESPAAFAAAEVALARARGWYIQLVINLTNGGSTPGQQMTPTQVEDALVAFADPSFADVLAGTGVGFTYNGSGSWMDDPAYQNALATGRNALAAL